MQHEDQHVEAVAKTVRTKDEVSASIFSDKVKEMGTVTVCKGRIEIKLDFVPSMDSEKATRDFLLDAIRVALAVCHQARPQAFEPHS